MLSRPLQPTGSFLLTIPMRFLCCSSSSLCVDGFICSVCFVIIFSSSFPLVPRESCATWSWRFVCPFTHIFTAPTKYNRIPMARTPMARLPWLIRTHFWVRTEFFRQLKKTNTEGNFLVLLWNCMFVYSLESPHTIILLKIENISINYRHMLPDLAPWLNLIGSNYPSLEQISMVPKMFEPLKFGCNVIKGTWQLRVLSAVFFQVRSSLWLPI